MQYLIMSLTHNWLYSRKTLAPGLRKKVCLSLPRPFQCCGTQLEYPLTDMSIQNSIYALYESRDLVNPDLPAFVRFNGDLE